MSEKYYVYIHRRGDSGLPFYVGKGHGKRAWSAHSRNRHWRSVYNKFGFSVEICQDGMAESEALLLEMWMIAKFRHEGVVLCNMTDGGEGVRVPQPKLRKPVVCSNGMEFESVNSAAEWAGVNGSKISSVLNGRRMTAGGFTWWISGDKPRDYVSPSFRIAEAKKKGVYRSDGVFFDSLLLAAESVSGSSANISNCARGKITSAYGYTWRYA